MVKVSDTEFQDGRRLSWELKRWDLRCFLNDATEGLFLI